MTHAPRWIALSINPALMRILPIGRRIGDAGRPSLAGRDLEWEANSYGFKRRSNSGLMGG